MATQFNAGLVAGQILTASTMNSIGASWETWVPTITSSGGAFTTVTTNSARYGRIQKIVVAEIDFTITTGGTAFGTPIFTLPVTASALGVGGSVGSYREIAATGLIGIVGYKSTTTFELFRYDNANHINTGNRYMASFTYEAA